MVECEPVNVNEQATMGLQVDGVEVFAADGAENRRGSARPCRRNARQEVETELGLAVLEEVHDLVGVLNRDALELPPVHHLDHDSPLILPVLGGDIERRRTVGIDGGGVLGHGGGEGGDGSEGIGESRCDG